MADERADGGFKVRIRQDGVQIATKRASDLTPLMERLATYLRQVSSAAFLNQSFDGEKWPERKVPSIMGIVEDLKSGPTIRPERWQKRPALVVTGALRRSIQTRISAKGVKVTSFMPYAKLMNDGGLNILPITQTVRQNLRSLVTADKRLRSSLGFLFRKWEVEATIPPRPFMGAPKSARAKIEAMTHEYLDAKEGA